MIGSRRCFGWCSWVTAGGREGDSGGGCVAGGAMKAKSFVFRYEQNKDLHATRRAENRILQIAGLLIIGPNKMIN